VVRDANAQRQLRDYCHDYEEAVTPQGFVGAFRVLLTILRTALGMPWWGALPIMLFYESTL